MADFRRFELDELAIRPGTYFNPHTEVLLVIDDSPDVDHEIFTADRGEGSEWVLIADEVPLDELVRDELIEHFQAASRRRAGGGDGLDQDDDEVLEDEEELEPDEELD